MGPRFRAKPPKKSENGVLFFVQNFGSSVAQALALVFLGTCWVAFPSYWRGPRGGFRPRAARREQAHVET